jgi:hypothetical protein
MSFDAPDPPEAKRSGHHWFDLLISVCALVTSGLSMYVAFNNDQSLERLVHANSWPFLQLASSNSDENNAHALNFMVKNAGTGPSRIFAFEFLVDGRPVSNDNVFLNVVQACCASEYQDFRQHVQSADLLERLGGVSTTRIAPDVLAANDNAHVMGWSISDDNRVLWTAMDRARQHGRITMRACYCSVFDECWIAQTNILPVRVNACHARPPVNAVSNSQWDPAYGH